jgi:serine/threonine protein phosphatase PrpC
MKVMDEINWASSPQKLSEDCTGFKTVHSADGSIHYHDFWVIDGATDVGKAAHEYPAQTPAHIYARTLSQALEEMAGDFAFDQNYFRAVLGRVREEMIQMNLFHEDMPTWEVPCASGVVVRFIPDEDQIKLAYLGDCTAILAQPDSHLRLTGSSQKDLEQAQASELQQQVGILRRDNPKVLDKLQEERHKRNSPDNPTLFSVYQEAAKNLVMEDISLSTHPAHLLLSSDGLMRIVDDFQLMSLTDFIRNVQDPEKGLQVICEELRSYERQQEHIPALKRHDDAAGLYIELSS